MDTNKLTLFLSLAKHLHFHRASAECNISPSTLSRTIQHLEAELNTQLFLRDNRTVTLTPQGKQLMNFSRQTLQQWETFQESLQLEAKELHGSIRIYCSVTASYSFLYDILTDFRQLHPQIEIKLHTGDHSLAVERVIEGHEDIAIAARKKNMPANISFKRISHSPLVFITAKDSNLAFNLAANNTKEQWEKTPMIISERGVARERINQWFDKQNIQPEIFAQVAGHEAIVSMVSLGFGIGLVPKIVVDNSPLAERVELYELQPDIEPYEVGVCVLEKRLKSPVVKALWEQIAEPAT